MFEFKKNANKKGSVTDAGATSHEEGADISSLLLGGSAMIGPTIVIEGKIISGENMLVEGRVIGSISAPEHEVTVGVSGDLAADISAKVVRVEGKVKGNISGSDKVIISKRGNVLGNIDAPRVTLEDGAKFKGSIEMDPGTAVLSELPTKASVNHKSKLVESEEDLLSSTSTIS